MSSHVTTLHHFTAEEVEGYVNEGVELLRRCGLDPDSHRELLVWTCGRLADKTLNVVQGPPIAVPTMASSLKTRH